MKVWLLEEAEPFFLHGFTHSLIKGAPKTPLGEGNRLNNTIWQLMICSTSKFIHNM
jgi:hypothetical protein